LRGGEGDAGGVEAGRVSFGVFDELRA
jgi:hypothetical protein